MFSNFENRLEALVPNQLLLCVVGVFSRARDAALEFFAGPGRSFEEFWWVVRRTRLQLEVNAMVRTEELGGQVS